MRRIILLGASNLTIGFPRIVQTLRRTYPGPLEVFAAADYGRSYGMWSRVLHRATPGITECGLWGALGSRTQPAAETLALVTDVGNDLLYGADPPQIAAWVETCLERLVGHRAETIMCLLPMGSVERLPAWRYYATRALFFPGSRIDWPEMQRRAAELDAGLRNAGLRQGVRLIEQSDEWYGFDPIHFRHTRRAGAWGRIFGAWSSFPEGRAVRRASPSTWLQVKRLQAERRRVFGVRRFTPQPGLDWGELRVWLY